MTAKPTKVYRSGPDAREQVQIRVMVAQGATPEHLFEKFPDVDPESLETWHTALQGKPAPTKVPAETTRDGVDGDMPDMGAGAVEAAPPPDELEQLEAEESIPATGRRRRR